MNNQVLIHEDLVNEDDLNAVLSSMKDATGADAYIEKQFVVTSDNPALLAALSTLFRMPAAAPETKKKARKARKPKAEAKKKPRGPYAKTYEITGGAAPFESIGTMLSAAELSQMLIGRQLPLGVEITHSKKGRLVVSLNGDPDGPFVLKKDSADGPH